LGQQLSAEHVEPLLKWPGGKRWLATKFPTLFPAVYKTYFEPFVGSGAVFFALQPAKATLSDINADLIHTYQVVRKAWKDVATQLRRHEKRHSAAHYYAVRATEPSSDVQRAARFIYLNKTCWNGLYRVNTRGQFNVPIGTKSKVSIDSKEIETLAHLLGRARLTVSDFEETISRACRGDFIFADPPYTAHHNSNGFLKYNDKLFSWNDQLRLQSALSEATRRGAKVVLTNADHPSLHSLYCDSFFLYRVSRASRISGLSHGRGQFSELLITNYRLT
jgi:DNA adenine methylase